MPTKQVSETQVTYDINSQIIKSLPTPMVAFDENYNAIVVNQGFKNIFSRYKKVIRSGNHISEVFHSHPDLHERIVDKILFGEDSEKFVYVLEDKFFLIIVNKIPEDDRISYIIMFQDITKQEEIESIRRKFISNVAHELRTPLAAISSHAELIAYQKSLTPEQVEKEAKLIYSEVKRLSKMVSELFDITKYDQSQIKLKREIFDIYDLLEEVDHLYALKETKMEIKTKITPIHQLINADYDKLMQVIINLFENAYTHTKSRIEIIASKKNHKLRIAVIDNGKGLTLEQKSKVFNRFYRTDSSRNSDLGGTGLGLSIVKEIVDLHNGQVFIQGEVNKGCEFIIEIPIGEI